MRCKRAIVRTLYARFVAGGAELQPDAMERAGMLGGQIRHGLASRMRGRWLPAMTDLLDDGIITPVGEYAAGTHLTEWSSRFGTQPPYRRSSDRRG